MQILDIHNQLFDFLFQYNQENSEFKFRTRKTNRANRLEEGYWFLGNKDYLSISFWVGNDWRARIPNISFMVDYEGSCWLHFSAETMQKGDFFINEIFPYIGLKIKSEEFLKRRKKANLKFKSKDIKECLLEFINIYYPIINEKIKKFSDKKLGINIINDDVFFRDIDKILKYKAVIKRHNDDIEKIRPSKISGFEINNYGAIEHLELHSIPIKSQWIFLTGENGVGKSSILKALASVIGFRKIKQSETYNIDLFECKIFTNTDSAVKLHYSRKGNNKTGKRKPLFLGFAAYGPFRLNPIYGGLNSRQLKLARSKNGHSDTLFNNDAYLLDLETQFSEWYETPNNQEFAKRTYAIKEFLEGILLNIGEIKFGIAQNNIPITLFSEIDDNDNLHKPVGIEKLSSGYMSIMSMMSDMLVRLYRQQPKIDDPAELRGVVLIDEIDIHLHPKFQKHFVEQLSIAFPKIQFIVSTHSPIPLLGAPKNSVVCVVKRNAKLGTYIERVDDKIYLEELSPNTILTSPIFGMEEISNSNLESTKYIRSEDTYSELKLNNEIDKKIEFYLTEEKQKMLIERLNKKKK